VAAAEIISQSIVRLVAGIVASIAAVSGVRICDVIIDKSAADRSASFRLGSKQILLVIHFAAVVVSWADCSVKVPC
jgi:hypothetical protein